LVAIRNIDSPDYSGSLDSPQPVSASPEELMHRVAHSIRAASEHPRRLVGAFGRVCLPLDTDVSPARSAPADLSNIGAADIRPPVTAPTSSPFDDIIAAVSGPLGCGAGSKVIDAPRSRFMVRVAKVDKPHRTTKRDYDYFEALNAALAEQQRHQPLPE
jgi:hypothetical protein